jgi:hypothetical protein
MSGVSCSVYPALFNLSTDADKFRSYLSVLSFLSTHFTSYYFMINFILQISVYCRSFLLQNVPVIENVTKTALMVTDKHKGRLCSKAALLISRETIKKYTGFNAINNLYMFRAGLLTIIRRYYAVYTNYSIVPPDDGQ